MKTSYFKHIITAALSLVCTQAAFAAVEEPSSATRNTRRLRGRATRFQKFRDTSCRTIDGDNGSKGTDFKLIKNMSSRKVCQKRCVRLGDMCFGYETSSSGKCELWKVPIGQSKLKYELGLGKNCYMKDLTGVLTPRPTPRPTPGPTDPKTLRPTPRPTPRPTDPKTLRPTPRPTPIPTDPKTLRPSPRPTPTPTDPKTLRPTPRPTLRPTLKPTLRPTLRPSPRPTPRPTVKACSPNKEVKIYKFWINGDDDSGEHGEHQLRLDGERYFPKTSSDCYQDPPGFCKWREGQVHNIDDKSPWKEISAHRSITVGTEEEDKGGIFGSGNDSYSASLAGEDWYIDTCEIYEVTLARDFKQERAKSVCWGVSATLAYKLAEISAEYKSCESWVEPAESFIWFLEVKPVW